MKLIIVVFTLLFVSPLVHFVLEPTSYSYEFLLRFSFYALEVALKVDLI
jgi:hypothetical protein